MRIISHVQINANKKGLRTLPDATRYGHVFFLAMLQSAGRATVSFCIRAQLRLPRLPARRGEEVEIEFW